MSKKAETTDFRKTLEAIGRKTGSAGLEVLRTFAVLVSCALSGGTREDEYLGEVKKLDRSTIELYCQAFAEYSLECQSPFAFSETAPDKTEIRDRLGPLLMERRSRSDKSFSGEFHTPWHLSQMLARIQVPSEWTKPEPCRMLEPSCGSGALVLAWAEAWMEKGHSLDMLTCELVDIDGLACRLAHIQCSVHGIPARIVHGNAISQEVWDQFATPAYAAQWERHRLSVPPAADVLVAAADARGQFALDLGDDS